ncbi:hypothetical protein BDN67DRAFT_328293 [Paxillus ammoniavirescens]|nr:hypothetical protein BDN67DRAFT_328293 [Paxillus ammoniavirescens]
MMDISGAAEPPSPRSKMSAGLEELTQIAARLARIGEEFSEAVNESTDEAAMYKARVVELEAKNLGTPEEHQIARNNQKMDADRKLKLIRRVMQGLLEELGPDNETSPTLGHSFRAGRVLSTHESRSPDLSNRRMGSVTNRPLMNTKPRADSEYARRLSSASHQAHPSAASSPRLGSSGRVNGSSAMGKASVVDLGPSRSLHSPTNTDPSLGTALRLPPPNLEDDNWRMSTIRTPKSAEIVCPIPWSCFEERLNFDEDTICSLER